MKLLALLVLCSIASCSIASRHKQYVSWYNLEAGRMSLPGQFFTNITCYLDGVIIAKLNDGTDGAIEDTDHDDTHFEANGKRLKVQPTENVTRMDLVVYPSTRDDKRNFTCVWDQGSKTIFPNVFGMLSRSYVEHGQNVTFQCASSPTGKMTFYYTVDANDPRFLPIDRQSHFEGRLHYKEYSKTYTDVNNKNIRMTFSHKDLTISDVTTADEGYYMCLVKNGNNDVVQNFTYRLVVKAVRDKALLSPNKMQVEEIDMIVTNNTSNVELRGMKRFHHWTDSETSLVCYRKGKLCYNGTVVSSPKRLSFLQFTMTGRRLVLNVVYVNDKAIGSYYCYWNSMNATLAEETPRLDIFTMRFNPEDLNANVN